MPRALEGLFLFCVKELSRMDYERLVTISEAARIMGVSETTLRRWDKTGVLRPTTRLSRGERLYRADLLAQQARQRASARER